MFIDEHQFNITENLYAALQRLQDHSIKRIWIDTIYINQQDQQERGHQVRSITKIYGRAHRVVVWLGEAADSSNQVFKEIRARKKRLNSLGNKIIRYNP